MLKKYWEELRLETYAMDQFEKESTVDKMINHVVDVSNWLAEGREVHDGNMVMAIADTLLLVAAGYNIDELSDKYVVEYISTDHVVDFIYNYITSDEDYHRGIKNVVIRYFKSVGIDKHFPGISERDYVEYRDITKNISDGNYIPLLEETSGIDIDNIHEDLSLVIRGLEALGYRTEIKQRVGRHCLELV